MTSLLRGSTVVAGLALLSADARAATDPPPAPACTITGTQSLATTVWSAATKGTALAELSWPERTLVVSDFPDDTRSGRFHVTARAGHPSIRVEGFVDATQVVLSSKRDLPVVAGHVAVAAGTSLRILRLQSGVLDAEPREPTFAKTRAALDCTDLRLGTAPPGSTPAVTKDWRLASKSVALLDLPGGKEVFRLVPLRAPGPIGSSTVQGAFAKIHWLDDVRIEGWVRVADLAPYVADDAFGFGGLGLSGIGQSGKPPPRIVAGDVEVVLDASPSALRVGVLEKGAAIHAHAPKLGYVAFTLDDGDVRPPAGKTFHVREKDLKLAP